MATKYVFDFDMACEGCYKAAQKVLGKIGIPNEDVTADLDAKKLYVTAPKTSDELLEALKKTGKAVSLAGTQ